MTAAKVKKDRTDGYKNIPVRGSSVYEDLKKLEAEYEIGLRDCTTPDIEYYQSLLDETRKQIRIYERNNP